MKLKKVRVTRKTSSHGKEKHCTMYNVHLCGVRSGCYLYSVRLLENLIHRQMFYHSFHQSRMLAKLIVCS